MGFNLRAAPSTEAETLAILASGTTLTVAGTAAVGDGSVWWYPVEDPATGSVGFVAEDYLDLRG